MIADIRLALRSLARSPGFTLLAVLILALGIGGAAAVFSVVNAALLRELPYSEPERIVTITTAPSPRVTGGDYLDFPSLPAFEFVSYYHGGLLNVRTRNGAEFAGSRYASPDFFQVLGETSLVAGRPFGAKDTSPAAVVTADFAARKFGRPEAAIGEVINLYEKDYPIIGVTRSEFTFPDFTSVWVMAPATPAFSNRSAFNYLSVARLRKGETIRSAQSQLAGLTARLALQFPSTHDRRRFTATSLHEALTSGTQATLRALLAAVLTLLLIACANVANLLLARGAARAREIAVRGALGAGKWVIVRMLLVESLLLATLSGLAGIALAKAGIQTLVALAPTGTIRANDVTIDGAVLLFTAGIALAATLLFGLLPAWQSTRVDIQTTLKQGGGLRGVVSGGSNRLRKTLVIVEIALAFALTISAGLIFRSFLKLGEVELGFQPSGVLVAYTSVPAAGNVESNGAVGRWFSRLPERLGQIPGVLVSSAAMGVPSGTYRSSGFFAVEGRHELKTARERELPSAAFRLTGADYFQTLGIRLVAGRDFTIRDDLDAPRVVIVSEALVRRVFAGRSPIGKRIQCGLDSPDWMTIVGIVADVRSYSPALSPRSEIYMPYLQHPIYADELQVVVRTGVPPATVSDPVRRAILAEQPSAAIRFETLDGMVANSVAMP
ncbi:MAG: FtsX-like permease family protein [Acidobacteria bacterium]|nr:FtsX-like permease family protein [Acidobacteriota bacterium]